MVMKFDPHGALMINCGNRVLIVFHLYRCSKHKLSMILMANVANLAHFVMLTFLFKTLFTFLCILGLQLLFHIIGLPL